MANGDRRNDLRHAQGGEGLQVVFLEAVRDYYRSARLSGDHT